MAGAEEIQSVTFGSYSLLERLAMGGMAEVFLARPQGQERFVAIKRILPNVAADDDFIAMFIDEAKIAGQLTHPNIAQILDIGKIQNSYFIAMEYISGHDVRALWDRVREAAENTDGPKGLPIATACHIVKKLAEGLDHAHRKRDAKGRPLGIIHRDVSPQNILISYDGDLKIIDFGIAKAANRIVKTQTGILKGKFAYMAPEQARGEPIDHRSDIFAIGVVLYELLTGERAFKGDTDFVLLEKVRKVDIIPARELRKDIPRELERIMLKALARDAGERYAWASALAGDLDRFMSDQGLTTSRDELGAFVRRTFRDEHAEEHRRLNLYRRRHDATERIDSVSGSRQQASFAEQATAVAEEPRIDELRDELRGEPTRTDDGEKIDTKRMNRRPRASQEGRQERAKLVDSMPSSPAAPMGAEESERPVSTGSMRRRRAAVAEPLPPLPPAPPAEFDHDESQLAPQGDFEQSMLGDSRMSAMSDGSLNVVAAPPSTDSVVVIAACLLGALLGAGLTIGVTMAVRSPPPDTLIVVTPRQSEVRLRDKVICAQTPCAVHLGTGSHELLLTAPGAEAVSRTVEVGDGAAVLDVTLDRTARAIRIETEPSGATVVLDGTPLPETTPLTLPPLVVGKSVRLTIQREGYDALTSTRIVEGDEVWRFDMPTFTTQYTLSVEPKDALIDAGSKEAAGKLSLTVGKKPIVVKVTRFGCEPVTLNLVGTGKPRTEQIIALGCKPLDARLAIVTNRRPAAVLVEGNVIPRGVSLDAYPMPQGTWDVSVKPARGKIDRRTLEFKAGAITEFLAK